MGDCLVALEEFVDDRGKKMNQEYIAKLFALSGQKAIVTGGSQGIGRSVAVALAAFGAEVTVIGRNQTLLDETVRMITEKGGVCHGVKLDVTDYAGVEQFFKVYREKNGQLDIFVNNAGYTVRAEFIDTAPEDVDGLIETNLKASIHFLQHAGRIMKEQRKGNIVIITSVNALNAHPGQGMYSVTKYALEGVMKAMASTLSQYGVRVNNCAPGAINTAINGKADPTSLESAMRKIPMGRFGEADEIGSAVACMVSDAFSYVTGSTIVVDGGMMLKAK